MRQELLNKLEGFLAQRLSIRELEDWLLGSLQHVLNSRDQAAIDVANQLDADLVELHEGIFDENEFRNRCAGYVQLAA